VKEDVEVPMKVELVSRNCSCWKGLRKKQKVINDCACWMKMMQSNMAVPYLKRRGERYYR
jgi:hypothetical protein